MRNIGQSGSAKFSGNRIFIKFKRFDASNCCVRISKLSLLSKWRFIIRTNFNVYSVSVTTLNLFRYLLSSMQRKWEENFRIKWTIENARRKQIVAKVECQCIQSSKKQTNNMSRKRYERTEWRSIVSCRRRLSGK